ncbi:hypothetical protein [Amycolatopsis sp. NPDC004625]|uniref:hypothetical protein n=1 Tax=Amycolatopsis sp. NPDC004625 TaxID=3154670 RepID=UPI0033A4731C
MSLRDLPPRRVLPDDVRDRLRAEVRQGIAKPRRSRHVWYAAAAAVLVLAAGAVVVTRQLRTPVEAPPATTNTGLTLDAKLATSALDRCWAAVRTAGKTGRVADRADWVPLFTDTFGTDSVVAATAAGKPMFCEVTETTVTLSDPAAAPAYAPGSRSGLLLHSATGLAAGVVDPAWPQANLATKSAGGSSSASGLDFSPASRQFVAFTGTVPAKVELAIGDGPGEQPMFRLPEAPPPLLSVTDRPADAERTSAAGRALGECLAAAEEVVADAPAYRAGPSLAERGYRIVLGRLGDRVVACTTEPGPAGPRSHAYPDRYTGPAVPARSLVVDTLGATEGGGQDRPRTPFAAVVPSTATQVIVDYGGGNGADTLVTDGMFAVWLPVGRLKPDAKGHVKAWDARGTVVYDGMLPLF